MSKVTKTEDKGRLLMSLALLFDKNEGKWPRAKSEAFNFVLKYDGEITEEELNKLR